MSAHRAHDLRPHPSRMCVLVALAALCGVSPLGAQGTVVTDLSVRNRLDLRRADAPVSWGIPLSPGDAVVNLGRLRLERGGHAVPAQFTARLHFFRGLAESRVDFRLENANAPYFDGQPQANDYGSPKSIAFDDVSLVFPALAFKRAWQSYPKAWRAQGGSVEVGLFPGEFSRHHQLRAGEDKTHTVWVRHHPPDRPDIAARARSLLAPLRLVPPAVWSTTRAALGYSAPSLEADFPDYERGTKYQLEISPELRTGEYDATDVFDAISRSQDYGWVDDGDVPTDFENPRSPYNLKYNAVAGLLQQAYRSDDERWWDLAWAASRHAADIDIQHSALRGPDAPRRWFEGGMYGHGYHDEDGERNPHRNDMNPSTSMAGPAPGLFLWAWASGDTLVLDSALELADNLYWKTTRTNYGGISALARTIARETGLQKCDEVDVPCDGYEAADGSRTGAHLIKAMRHAWLATGDARYLDLVTSLSAYLRRLEQTTGPSCDRFSFQTIFIAGLGQHLLWLREAGLSADEWSRQLLSQRIDYMVNTLWNPATSQFRTCYDSPTLFPIQDNWLFTVADAFAAGALVLDRPELVHSYARPLFEYGAANQFYPGSFVGYHSTKELVNQAGFGHLFLYAWWRIHATPVIAWVKPASIVYGTPLSATQLNATTTVPGVFVYTPAAGTVLAVGTRRLSTRFTPTDTVNYTTATKTVSIDVVPVAVGIVKGKVSNASGQVIAGATVSAYLGTTLYKQVASDVAGVYAMTVAAGTYTLKAKKTGSRETVMTGLSIVAGQIKNVPVTLYKGSSIAGTITRSTTGAAIAGVRLQVLQAGKPIASTTTNRYGKYGPVLIARPGSYTIEAAKAGYLGTSVPWGEPFSDTAGRTDPAVAARSAGASRFSASRTFAARSWIENGFWTKCTPSSSTPRWAITSAGYPDMNNRAMCGYTDSTFLARSPPFNSGMTTSVISKWISPVCSRARRIASPGVCAASTV